MSYYSNVNPELFNVVPANAMRVLELGCGAGALGRAFLGRNPKAKWIGVELFPEAAEQARECISEVVVGDCEAPAFFEQFKENFDCIVAGDVLEHLRDPWSVLKTLRSLLTPNGTLCICVPNIGHISIVKGLLQGRFHYTDAGLLDRTHLRFFTRESLLEALRGAEFSPEKLIPRRVLADESTSDVLLKAMKFGEPHSSAYQQAMSDLNAFQFVVRSVPKGSESLIQPKLVIAMLALAPSFADVRTKDPLALLGALPGVRTHYFERDFSIPNYPIELPKVVIVQRQLVMDIPGWRASLDKLHERGWAVIAEWDDHPDLFAPEIRAKFDKHPWASVLMADAVQVSTPSLAEHIEAIARREHRELNLKVIENKVLSLGYAPRSALVGRRLKVFLGALNRWADFRLLIEAIQSVKGLADRLEFTIISNDSQAQPIEGLNVLPPCSRQDYLKHLAACDVCLCPLSDSEANRCKSPVKWLEASSMGVVTLASAVVYGEVIRHDEDGLLFHTPQGAAQLLEGLVADPSRITRLREAATLRMKADFMLVDDLQPRIDWYLQVAEKLSLR